MYELVEGIFRFTKFRKIFDPPEIKMYIELLLAMLGEFLFIVFPSLEWYYLVQNGAFSVQN